MRPRRRRLSYAIAVLAVIAVGLASRHFPGVFPAVLGKYPGDALWALMVFLGWAVVLPGASTLRLGAVALASSYAVEFSQIYQAPWLNAVRGTTAGHLVLGSTFNWPDLLAYAAGIALGISVEMWVRRARHRPPVRIA